MYFLCVVCGYLRVQQSHLGMRRIQYDGCRMIIRPTLQVETHQIHGHGLFRATNTEEISSSLPTNNIKMGLLNVNRLYYRASWFSWWLQIILSVVSGVTLTFANSVRPTNTRLSYLWLSGYSFSSIGAILAFVNSFWTWNVTRLCRRVSSKKVEESKATLFLKRYSQISVVISMVGMMFSVLGAEQIAGTLTSKILSSGGGYSPFLAPTMNAINPGNGISALSATPIQAVDIFLVQANANTMLAHFISLICYLLLQTRLPAEYVSTANKAQTKPAK